MTEPHSKTQGSTDPNLQPLDPKEAQRFRTPGLPAGAALEHAAAQQAQRQGGGPASSHPDPSREMRQGDVNPPEQIDPGLRTTWDQTEQNPGDPSGSGRNNGPRLMHLARHFSATTRATSHAGSDQAQSSTSTPAHDRVGLGAPADVVFILGGPGAGKGTVCEALVSDEELASRFRLRHLSAGQLLRDEVVKGTAEGQRLAEILASGKIVPSSITVSLLLQAMRNPSAGNTSGRDRDGLFLIDGFPRNMENQREFERQFQTQPRAVVNLYCDFETLKDRVMQRRRTSVEVRSDDNLDVLKKRWDTFERETKPVLRYFAGEGLLRTVDASHPPATVAAAVQKILEGTLAIARR